MTTATPSDSRRLRWCALDVIAVCLFVAVGRINHAEGFSAAGYGHALWPFLVGLAVGWLLTAAVSAVRTSAWTPQRPWVGMVCVVTVVGVGMALRWASGQGVAVAFVIVATVSNILLLIGWRLVVLAAARGRD